MLNDGLARVQYVRVGHMMHKEQQFIRTRCQGFILFLYFGRILPDVSRSGCDRAIHSDALRIRSNPLSPAVVLGRIGVGLVMRAENVGESSYPKRPGIAFINMPGR